MKTQVSAGARREAARAAGQWYAASGARGRKIWWITRAPRDRYDDKRGRLVTFATIQAAQKRADQLNALNFNPL